MATQTTTVTQPQVVTHLLGISSKPSALPEFDDTTEWGDWRDEFARYGCAVIKGVIPPGRAKYYVDKQIEWLKKFELGFDDKDPETWTNDHLPVNFKEGMYFGYAATHEDFVWEARTERGVIDVFEKVWSTNQLLTSFDGMNISMPKRKDVTWTPWPHTDQKPERKGMEAVQGLLNFAPNGPKDGGLILMRGTSKVFDKFHAHKRASGGTEDITPPELRKQDIFLFREKDIKWFESHGFVAEKLNLDPGDMVVWDSRTVHYACLPEGDQIRHIQYICMTPREFADREALEAKKNASYNYISTSHWPHCNIPSKEENVTVRNGLPCPKSRTEPFAKPVLTDAVLRLAGVMDY